MRKLTVGIVGAGRISHSHVPGWQALGADIVFYSLEDAEPVARRYGAQVAESLEELLQRVDVVDVCTPTPAHVATVRAALMAGKDVVCEKPLARTAEDSRALVALAAQLRRKLFPGHVVRFFREYAAAKRAVDAGRLGDLAVLRFTRSGVFPAAPWFADEEASGGIIMDQMIHDLDQAVWMAGPVSTVFATGSRVEQTPPIETAHVLLTHESGAISHCRGLWGAPSTAFSYSFHIAGTGGVLSYDSQRDTGFDLDAAARQSILDNDGFTPKASFGESPFEAELREFGEAMLGGPEPRVSAQDGLYAVELSLAALESLKTGHPVAMSSTSIELAEAEA